MESNEYNKLIKKAQEYAEKEDYLEAIAIYKMAFKYEIHSNDYADLIYYYLRADKLEEALVTIKDYLKLTHGEYLGYYYYGKYYAKQNDYKNAIKKYKIALRKGLWEVNYRIGFCYQELSENNQKYLNKALKYYKNVIKRSGYDYDTYFNISLVYERKKKIKKALSYALTAYSNNKEYPDIAFNIGNLYARLKEYENMEKYYLLEIANANPNYRAFYNLALYYKEIKEYEKAQEYYIKGLGYCKDDYRIWYNLGCLYSIMEKYKKASDCFYSSYLLNDKTIDYIIADDETQEFIKSSEFEDLKHKTK